MQLFGVKLWYVPMVVVSLTLGIFFLWGIGQFAESLSGYSWPHVTGVIVSSAARSKLMHGRFGDYTSYWPDVHYEYEAGGQRYVGTRVRFIVRGMSKSDTKRVVRLYPPGRAVAVYYDPDDARASVLEPGVWWLLIPILLFAAATAVVLSGAVYRDYQKTRFHPSDS